MIRDLLKPELIVTNLEVGQDDKATAIRTISKMCSTYSHINEDTLFEMFMDREALDSTGFGNHIAIPHAKIKGFTEAFIGIFKFSQPVEWEALDDEPVKVAIALVMPGDAGDNTHLQVISKFSRKLMDDDFVETLLEEDNQDKIYSFIINELEG